MAQLQVIPNALGGGPNHLWKIKVSGVSGQPNARRFSIVNAEGDLTMSRADLSSEADAFATVVGLANGANLEIRAMWPAQPTPDEPTIALILLFAR